MSTMDISSTIILALCEMSAGQDPTTDASVWESPEAVTAIQRLAHLTSDTEAMVRNYWNRTTERPAQEMQGYRVTVRVRLGCIEYEATNGDDVTLHGPWDLMPVRMHDACLEAFSALCEAEIQAAIEAETGDRR